MKSVSSVAGSRERETMALMVAVLGMMRKVQDWRVELVEAAAGGGEELGRG